MRGPTSKIRQSSKKISNIYLWPPTHTLILCKSSHGDRVKDAEAGPTQPRALSLVLLWHRTVPSYLSVYQLISLSPSAQLSCLPHLFQAVIDRGYLRRLGYSSWDIHLNDRMCRPQVTGRYLIFNIPYGHCGTVMQVRGWQGGSDLLWMECKKEGLRQWHRLSKPV
jgi:hypothetical protein